jgi:hypothetical protein
MLTALVDAVRLPNPPTPAEPAGALSTAPLHLLPDPATDQAQRVEWTDAAEVCGDETGADG